MHGSSPLSSVRSSASTMYTDYGGMDLTHVGSDGNGDWERGFDFVNDVHEFCLEPNKLEKRPNSPAHDIAVH